MARQTVLDKRFSVCYNKGMKTYGLIYGDITAIHIRERRLDRELLALPSSVAQQIEVELIKKAQVTSPWLLPIIMRYDGQRKHPKSSRTKQG